MRTTLAALGVMVALLTLMFIVSDSAHRDIRESINRSDQEARVIAEALKGILARESAEIGEVETPGGTPESVENGNDVVEVLDYLDDIPRNIGRAAEEGLDDVTEETERAVNRIISIFN